VSNNVPAASISPKCSSRAMLHSHHTPGVPPATRVARATAKSNLGSQAFRDRGSYLADHAVVALYAVL
jgi:hypothetical protein